MAKANFQKGQRVWVECVGAWALIEKVVPVWAKGFAEPVRITYDVGFGREFNAQELQAERIDEAAASLETGDWRLLRARNKWQAPEDCPHHPYPGSYPVVVTDATDWGGWRVPGAEYDRDPHKIELQARLIVNSPRLLKMAEELIAFVEENDDDAPQAVVLMASKCSQLIRNVLQPAAPPDGDSQGEDSVDPSQVAAE